MATKALSIEQRCINSIRFLAADAIQRARSGHPGLPMGAAPMAFALWDRFLEFNPKNPGWFDRDRFVLSAGHGSMLLYALMHLYGYDSVTMDDILAFRQWKSRTPGHPENRSTPGVEVTTGPLGQGVANAVGLAIAEAHLAARFNKPDCEIVNHRTWAVAGDGCMMEGITYEAASMAGHLGLGKLNVLYDDNRITIDGSTDLTFSEDVNARFEACGWHVVSVEDGDNDVEGISRALAEARDETDRPSLVRIRTTIGFGSPGKADSADAHGAPLGEDEVAATRDALGWPYGPFEVPRDVIDHTARAIERGMAHEARWETRMTRYREDYPEDAAAFEALLSGDLPDGWEDLLPTFDPDGPPTPTRAHSGICLNALAGSVTGLIGGSADLSPSNKTLIESSGDFARGAHENRNIRFGVREHAMGAICTGIALHRSGLIPYCATFLVFVDYMRAAIRTAALSRAGVLYIMSHDSIAVGEDGPTHQPTEHITTLRTIPDLAVVRPADGTETAGAYRVALSRRNSPTLLALSRQNVRPVVPGTSAEGVTRGAYAISGGDETPDIILIGTGAELGLCAEAAEILRGEGVGVRVVSMPCWEVFEAQDRSYRESVLPPSVTRRLSVEAGSTLGWCRYVGPEGASVGVDCFGKSAPGAVCLEKHGFSVSNIAARARDLLG